MPFHNRLLDPDVEADTSERVPFHQLKQGEQYRHKPGGQVEVVTEYGPGFRTIQKQDGWLIGCKAGDWVWEKSVIRVAPGRK